MGEFPNDAAGATQDSKQHRGRAAGMVPIMKAITAMKEQLANLSQRIGELEGEFPETKGAVQGILKGSLVECPECESFLQAQKFPKHWLKMHPPEPEIEGEVCEGEVGEDPLSGNPWVVFEIEEDPMVGEPLTEKTWVSFVREVFPKRPPEEVATALQKLGNEMRERRGWI